MTAIASKHTVAWSEPTSQEAGAVSQPSPETHGGSSLAHLPEPAEPSASQVTSLTIPTLAQPLELAYRLAADTKSDKSHPAADAKATTASYKEMLDWANSTYAMSWTHQTYFTRLRREPYHPGTTLFINDAVATALVYAEKNYQQDPAAKDYRQVISLAVLIMAADGQPVSDYEPLLTTDHFPLARQLDPSLPARDKGGKCVIM